MKSTRALKSDPCIASRSSICRWLYGPTTISFGRFSSSTAATRLARCRSGFAPPCARKYGEPFNQREASDGSGSTGRVANWLSGRFSRTSTRSPTDPPDHAATRSRRSRLAITTRSHRADRPSPTCPAFSATRLLPRWPRWRSAGRCNGRDRSS